ncbi:MAG: PKD domain-containing protein [Candidatus Paceibacterota bacterium]
MKKETNKNKKINLILYFLFSCICFFSFIDIASAARDVSGYAWSENIGWVNFYLEGFYGVSLGDDNILTGYAWSENIGWISFESSELTGCPSGTCNARIESGKIVGWARQLNLADGWIKLGPNIIESTDYGAYLSNNNILGYAWSDNFGWLSFSCENQGSCGTVQYGVSIEGNISTSNYVTNINYCNHLSTPTVNTGLTVSFNWDYTGESSQDSYTIQVSTDSSFTSPFEVTANTSSTSYILNLEGSEWNSEQLNWGSVYYWRVMVESELGDVSSWSSAQTINISRTHASPLVTFSNSPQIILEGRTITFTPESGETTSQTYDDSTPVYAWTFTGGDPETSTESSVEVTFEESETYPVLLRVTDDSGYYCEMGEDVNTKIFNPIWRIISPY